MTKLDFFYYKKRQSNVFLFEDMPAQRPKKSGKEEADGKKDLPQKSKTHPSPKQKISKVDKSHAPEESKVKTRGTDDTKEGSNARPQKDKDDMDEIFSSKPSKEKKAPAKGMEKETSSGPDQAEIAKEAEKYKGSGSQGANKGPRLVSNCF